jgi:hypothetical protein
MYLRLRARVKARVRVCERVRKVVCLYSPMMYVLLFKIEYKENDHIKTIFGYCGE